MQTENAPPPLKNIYQFWNERGRELFSLEHVKVDGFEERVLEELHSHPLYRILLQQLEEIVITSHQEQKCAQKSELKCPSM